MTHIFPEHSHAAQAGIVPEGNPRGSLTGNPEQPHHGLKSDEFGGGRYIQDRMYSKGGCEWNA